MTILTVQYNEQTKNVTVDDKFMWANDVYEIIDINAVGLSIGGEYGVLKIQAKKTAGGIDYGNAETGDYYTDGD